MKNIEDIAIREFNGPAKVYCFREDNFIKYMNNGIDSKFSVRAKE